MKNRKISLFKGFFDFLSILWNRRFLIGEMAKRDVSISYAGSLLGFVWIIINPIVTICIFWLIFSVGFKTAPKGGAPFVVWFASGLASWNAFSQILNDSTSVMTENKHLVKKIAFPLSILPVVKLVSSFITHIVFLFLIIILLLLYGMPVSIYWVQFFYYFFAMCVLALGLGWITSAINVFVRDAAQIVSVLLQFGFWGTPIFWDVGIMPQKLQFLLKLNPMYYVVQGYRESFIYSVPFWGHWQMTLYYWGVTAAIFLVGALIFLRLRPHFADVM